MSVIWVSAGINAIGVIGGMSAASDAQDGVDQANRDAKSTADAQLQLGREELDFTKLQYNDAKPYRDKAAATSQEVAEAQLASQRQSDALASDYASYNKTTFRPLEQSMVAEAQAYDTPEKRQAAADAAASDVNRGFASSNEANARRLASMGVNPGSAKAMAVMDGQAVDQATAIAGSAYKARQGVETVGRAMKSDAVALGRNLPSSQATSAQVALTAGNSASNNSTAALNAVNAGTGAVQAGYSGAISAGTSAGSLFNSAATRAQTGVADSSALWGSLGKVGGSLLSKYMPTATPTTTGSNPAYGYNYENGSDIGFTISDENMKTDIKPANDDEALEAVNATPVKKWKYSAAKMAGAGLPMDDGAEHTGPMAQDVNANMGEAAAPGGKMIDPITLTGVNMQATKAIDKKVDKLAREVSSLSAMIRSGKVQARAAPARAGARQFARPSAMAAQGIQS